MRLVLCDDHVMFLHSLETVLTSGGLQVEAVTHDVDRAPELVSTHRPDVCVLDVRFPAGSGIDTAAVIRRELPAVKLLLLTADDSPAMWRAFHHHDVDAVVHKASGLAPLVSALTQVTAGLRVAIGWDDSAVDTGPAAPVQELTPREQEVLRLLTRGVSTRQLAETLGVSRNTVRSHVQSLSRKLGVHSRIQAVGLVGETVVGGATERASSRGAETW
jgi:two-component system, NarL family, nitrate/nitrite response regulator NarL